MSGKLLPCPFCGGTQLEVSEQVVCSTCWATGPDPYNQNDCTATWNDRAALSPSQAPATGKADTGLHVNSPKE